MKYIHRRYLVSCAIAGGLFLYWVAMTFLFNNRLSFSVITYTQQLKHPLIGESTLLAGDTVSLEFTAQEDHLGIVYIRFLKPTMVPYEQEDTLVFRLRKKEGNSVLEEGSIRSGLIRKSPFLPIGFSPIDQSKDRTYVLELESLAGTQENGVALSAVEPRMVTAYKFDRREITSSVSRFVTFMVQRNIQYFSSFRSIELVSVLLVYLVPLAVYCIQRMRHKTKSVRHAYGSIGIVFVTVLLYTCFVTTPDIATIVLVQAIIVWITLIRIYTLSVHLSLLHSFLWMAIGVVAISVAPLDNAVAAKSSVWFFLFLVIAVGQRYVERLRHP